MGPKRKADPNTGKTRRDRYWSVMLVGEHGRIVPLKWFKSALIAAVGVFILTLAAAIVVGLLYRQQSIEVDRLHVELQESKALAAKLRDEKDLYLTRFIASQKAGLKNGPARPQKQTADRQADGAKTVADTPAPAPKKAVRPEPAPKPEAAAKVKWKADIRRFNVSYDSDEEVLKARFRIYNTSKPKRRLSGRIVVVFKKMGTAPVKWFPVPQVQISGGTPKGDRGQAFKINNYRTVTFRAYKQKPPVAYDTASVFVFSANGDLITERDFPFQIKHRPKAASVPKSGPSVKAQTPAKPSTAEQQSTPAPAEPAAARPKDNNPDGSIPVKPSPSTGAGSGSGPATGPATADTVPATPENDRNADDGPPSQAPQEETNIQNSEGEQP